MRNISNFWKLRRTQITSKSDMSEITLTSRTGVQVSHPELSRSFDCVSHHRMDADPNNDLSEVSTCTMWELVPVPTLFSTFMLLVFIPYNCFLLLCRWSEQKSWFRQWFDPATPLVCRTGERATAQTPVPTLALRSCLRFRPGSRCACLHTFLLIWRTFC